jgi:excisionase family DNA binding protein
MSPGEVARLLHVDASTVRRMVRAGDLPAVRVGGQWRLDPATVERLVAAASSHPERTAA